MLEDFKNHPSIAPLLKGGRVMEHSGHMVPEGGFDMMPPLIGDGVLLAGESAMTCVNLGYMVRGIDYAIAAGMHAGQAAAVAITAGDTSATGLKGYKSALEASFVMKDMKQFRRFPHFMEEKTRLYNEYPELIRDIARNMFIVNGNPKMTLKESVWPLLKEVGLRTLWKDAREGMKAL
jgi:electron transfer flavoprotein-quinone oxidoreductase